MPTACHSSARALPLAYGFYPVGIYKITVTEYMAPISHPVYDGQKITLILISCQKMGEVLMILQDFPYFWVILSRLPFRISSTISNHAPVTPHLRQVSGKPFLALKFS
jgi:hypothetical protein